MLVEQIIKQTVDLQGFRVDTVTKDPDGLIAEIRLGCDAGHADILPSTGIGERCDSFVTRLCGIYLSGSNMSLVGCPVPGVEAYARSDFPG